MKYLGGKSRIAKQIGAFLNSEIERLRPIKYIEPFCGACWITQEIKPDIQRIACDIHPDLILMWKELQKGWIPPEDVSKEEYYAVKNEVSSALRGFIGFGCSFSGKWFGGYAYTEGRNYAANAKNSLLKQIFKLRDVHFKNCSYLDVQNIQNRIIYNDPPYASTTSYSCGKFNSDEFWQWVRETSLNNYVYTSEYTAPADFEVVFEIATKTDMSNKEGKKENRIEKLFKYKG